MQAIILAAGMGKRLGVLTQNQTKCMVSILGKTIIERTLEEIIKVGIKKVVLVIGYKGIELKNFIGAKYKELEIVYIENEVFDKTNNIYSLYLAKEFLTTDDNILIESDLLFDSSVLQSLVQHKEKNVAIVARFESWMDGTVVTIDENDNILSFIPKSKFKFDNINEYFKTVNIYKFSKEFCSNHYIPFLEAYCKSMGQNEYYEDVLRVIAYLEKSNLKAYCLPDDQKWYEIDDVQDIQNAEAIFADGNTKIKLIENRFGGFWRFPKMVDFCYLVNPFFPSERLINEMKSNFSDLLCQYPSGLNVNCLVASKVFGIDSKEILVGNGAAEIINCLLKDSKKTYGVLYPTFEEYSNRIDVDRLRTFYSSNDDFSYTIADLIKIAPQVDSLILINPDNPSGQFIEKKDVLKLLDFLTTTNKELILDESFVDFSENGEENTLIDSNILSKYPNLIVVKSISKSYGIPGIRLGVMATKNQERLLETRKNLSIWNINSFGEFFLQIFDKYDSDYKKAHFKFIKERKRFLEKLKEIPYLRVIPSQANYFLCEVKEPFKAAAIAQELLCNFNILIKNCSAKKGFNNKEFVRIAVRNDEDNDGFINALFSLSKK